MCSILQHIAEERSIVILSSHLKFSFALRRWCMPLKQQTVLLSWTLHSHPSRLSCMLFCGIYLPLILDCPMHKLVISLYWDQKLLKYTLHGSCNLQHIAHYFFTTYFFMKSVQQVITIFISYMKIIIFNTPFFLCLIVIAFELTGT